MRLASLTRGREVVRDLTAFGGLNRTDDFVDGELADCENLSTRRFPCLAPRAAREVVATYENASAYYCFDGHTVVCADGRLLFDGEDKCAVVGGEKHFAVVGKTLCVFPDKVMLDVETGEAKRMDDGCDGTNVSFSGDTVSAPPLSPVLADLKADELTDGRNYTFYRCSEAQISAAWNGETWDLDALAEYRVFSNDGVDGAFAIVDDDDKIPAAFGEVEPRERYNRAGRFARSDAAQRSKLWFWYYVKRANAVRRFADVFSVGDAVDVVGSRYGIYDREALSVTAIDDAENAMTLAGASFPERIAYAGVLSHDLPTAADVARGYYVLTRNGEPLRFGTAPLPSIAAGSVICMPAFGGDIRVWSESERKWTMQIVGYVGQSGDVADVELTPYALAEQTITLRRAVPDLDFVCEHQNRLWGVSNEKRTVYASALGEVAKFWQFDGVSTDSYQLTVGGEGDFTAICSYGGAVCLFRERKLHKILGGYPAEYYLTSRDVAGVQRGCAKSVAQLGGALYYKGVSGVYRFTGSAAECVSKKLGVCRSAARGGADGRRYYLSTDGGIFVFDTQTALWLREDGLDVTDFAFDGTLLMLAGDTVWRIGDGAPDAAFSARLVPFSERVFARKRYVRFSLEATLGAGAYLTVEARQDGGAWRAVGTLAAGTAGVRVLRLAPMRCGSLELRLRGKGDVAVSALRRRFEARSERES